MKKRELERIVNDIDHPNQIFLTKPNTGHGYNLRSKPGSVAIPKSGTQRHTKSCKTPPFMICISQFLPTFSRNLLNSNS